MREGSRREAPAAARVDTLGLLLLVGLLLAAWASPALAWRWQACGPRGGPITDMAVSPGQSTHLLAIHPTAGLYRSDDGGARWARGGDDLKNPWGTWWLTSVAFNDEGNLAAVGTRGSGLFLSSDGGFSWHPGGIGFDLSVDVITRIQFDPRNDQHLLVGTNAGLFQSIDGGQSFQRCPLPIAGRLPGRVLALTFHPADSLKAYVALESDGLYASNDGGLTWLAAGNGLFGAPGCIALNSRQTNDALVAGREGVARWQADARRWVPVGAGLTRGAEITTLLRLPGDGRRVLAGTRNGRLFLSPDGGERWERLPGAPMQPGPLTLGQARDGKVYLAGGGGVFRSLDDGRSWEAVDDGLVGMAPRTLLAPDRMGRLLVGGAGGLLETTDFGDDWRRLGEGLRGPQFAMNDLRANPRNTRRLAAATDGGVVLSDDGGATWRSTPLGNWMGSIAWLPRATPPAIVACGINGQGSGAWRSDDGGATWRDIFRAPLEVGAWVAADTLSGALYIGMGDLLRSADGGVQWEVIDPPAGSRRFTALVTPTLGSPRLMAGTDDGLYQSEDQGRNWTRAGLAGRRIVAVTAGRVDERWLAALTPGGLSISRDGGTSWSDVSLAGIGEPALQLALDPSDGLLYLATASTVYASRIP